MSETTLPLPTKPNALDRERWLMTSTLEMALANGAEPALALMVAVVVSLRWAICGVQNGRYRRPHGCDYSPKVEALTSLPPETLQVCHEALGRPLAHEELDFSFRAYRDLLSVEDQLAHSKIIRAILPSLPRLKDTGANRIWDVLDDSRH